MSELDCNLIVGFQLNYLLLVLEKGELKKYLDYFLNLISFKNEKKNQIKNTRI